MVEVLVTGVWNMSWLCFDSCFCILYEFTNKARLAGPAIGPRGHPHRTGRRRVTVCQDVQRHTSIQHLTFLGAITTLGQQFLEYPRTGHLGVGQPFRPSGVAERQTLMIQSHQVQDRGVQIVNADLVPDMEILKETAKGNW